MNKKPATKKKGKQSSMNKPTKPERVHGLVETFGAVALS